MKAHKTWWRQKWIGVLIGLLIYSCFLGPYDFEPTDEPRCFGVVIVSYRTGGRGSQYFTVVSQTTGESWEVGAARGPFPPEYRGPAVVVARRGRWTGTDHIELLQSFRFTTRPDTTLAPTVDGAFRLSTTNRFATPPPGSASASGR
jgi:hypothetical protein